MDELFCPTSSGSPSSPASFFSVIGGGEPSVLEFLSCDIPEQWLGSDDGHPDDGAVGSRSAGSNDQSSAKPPAPPAKRRGRKPASRSRTDDGPIISHVEAERQRRDKLNRRFCELRAAVPTVSRMDKASLLADAVSYISELRGRIEKLEAQAAEGAARNAAPTTAPATAAVASPFGLEEKLEVRMVGRESATLCLTSAARHVPARLMEALRLLDLPLQHASVCRAGVVTVVNAVVDVPAGPLQNEAFLQAALLYRLQGNGSRNPFQIN
jgi:hypothetical protein